MTTGTLTPNHPAIAVFTGKSADHILRDGGSQSWKLSRHNAQRCEYVVCCRSGVSWAEGPEPKGSAFLVGRISGIQPSTETAGRWLIAISHFAKVSVPEVWKRKGWRNPVRYTDLEGLGIDPTTLTFEPIPEPETVAGTNGAPIAPRKTSRPLTISEAKRGLAQAFGVAEDAVEITVHG